MAKWFKIYLFLQYSSDTLLIGSRVDSHQDPMNISRLQNHKIQLNDFERSFFLRRIVTYVIKCSVKLQITKTNHISYMLCKKTKNLLNV